MKRFFVPVAVCLAVRIGTAESLSTVPYHQQWDVKFESLPASQVLDKMDLTRPALEAVRNATEKGERTKAMAELLRYYRHKYPPASASGRPEPENLRSADQICRHVFQWGPYAPADYGKDIDWTIDPAHDIEWVAAVYRFYWADDLAKAYASTHDDKYARAFVELTTDWIARHPLSDWTRTHPTLTHWKGFAWLDLQTGIRASRATAAFKTMLHSPAITPEFLGIFLASMYDHQVKTARVPMGAIHNKAIFEQRGVLNICDAFPEFADTPRWARLAMERACENLLAQTTSEGVQREWCGSYHLAVLNDSLEIIDKASHLGLTVPGELRARVRAMCDYVLAVATPDLAWPMFGDTARPQPGSDDPHDAMLYSPLLRMGRFWKDPKFEARAKMDLTSLPGQASRAFESAGMYVMRSGWGRDDVYLALHCPPPALSGHDQPDNGTFELYAYGRWLLTDSGFYTYGHDRDARAWHRKTRVHQTLTLDGQDSKIDGRLRLWQSSPELEALVVENPSYDGLLHRRSVWFVGKQYFVLLDEAIGNAPGELRLHWTPAPGKTQTGPDQTSITTQFTDANVLIKTSGAQPMHIEAEDGWFAREYGHREPRTMFSVKHPGAAPAAFLTVIAPYRGTNAPPVEATLIEPREVGAEKVDISLRASDKNWKIGRSLETRTAWSVAGQGATTSPASAPAGRAAISVDRPVDIGSEDHEDEFPAAGCDKEGHVWVCWVAFNGTADAVLARKLDDKPDATPVTLSKNPGDHWRPAMGTDGQGRLWATWAQNDQGRWDIRARFLADGRWSDEIRLTKTPGNDFAQKLATDASGTLWMTWQSAVDDNYEVLLAPITPDGTGTITNVSHHPANDWEPAITTTGDGRICVAWDSYRSGSYDILLAEMKNGQLAEPIGIAATPAYEAHATIAADRQNRLWIAWDNGGLRWGEDNEQGRKLHSERSVGIRCLDNGQLHDPAEPLATALSGPLATFCELPELITDGEGRLWMFVRHLTDLTPKRPAGRPGQTRGIWNPYVLCYSGNHWSVPQPLPSSNGRNDMRVSACRHRDGRVCAAWADDGRKAARAEEPQTHTVHASTLVAPAPPAGDLAIQAPAQPPPVVPTNSPVLARHKLVAANREYTLFYGDTHRHTDLSRCGMNSDGSLMDTYRYAIDVARLDFLAISDHDQDLLKHRYDHQSSRLQQYGWWRSEKYCDLFLIEHRFVPIYAYEHGGSFAQRGGHKNILYLERGQPCYEVHSPEQLFKALEGKEAVAIPHQLADGPSAVDWKKWNPEFERVAEVFQARGSYEFKGAQPPVTVSRDGHYIWDALAMGVRVGMIASSDHGMVHNAYAGVYGRELSRAGVMEALKSRRTFGSMDRMAIELRLGDRLLGEEVEIAEPPAFNVLIEAPRPIRKIQVVRNGAMVHTSSPGTPSSRLKFIDSQLQPGQAAWYYVRCEQDNDKYGWSSPMWIKRK